MRKWESHQVARRLKKSALGCQRTRLPRAAVPPPKVVAQREFWKVQPEAEGYQGRHGVGGQLLLKIGDQELASSWSWEPVQGAQSRHLHPGPQRPAGKRWAGAAPREPQGQRGLPLPTSLLPPQHPGSGSGSGRKGSGARPWVARAAPATPATPSSRCRRPQAGAPGRPRLPQPLS